MSTIKTDDTITKSDLKQVCAYTVLISGAICLIWYFFLQLFLYMEVKQTIPETGLQMKILVLGIVFVTFGYIFLRWEGWLNPKI